MLFNIYLGTTAVSWATTLLFIRACNNRLNREGYKFHTEKESLSEKLIKKISMVLKMSIPIYNISNSILLFCMGGDKVYEKVKNELLKEEKIYKVSDIDNKSLPKISTKEQIERLKNERDNLLRCNKETKTEKTNSKLREQIECLKNERNLLFFDEIKDPKPMPPIKKL